MVNVCLGGANENVTTSASVAVAFGSEAVIVTKAEAEPARLMPFSRTSLDPLTTVAVTTEGSEDVAEKVSWSNPSASAKY